MIQDENEFARHALRDVPLPVDFDDQATRAAWCSEFGATEEQLPNAAARVGRMPEALRFHLTRPPAKARRGAPAVTEVAAAQGQVPEELPRTRPANACTR